AVELIAGQARLLEQQELLADAEGLVGRVRVCNPLEEALQGVSYVQENLPEKPDLKREIFRRMDALASADPVVELCGAPWTNATTLEAAHRIQSEAGQKPVIVRRELEGFVLNRLQGALLREAFRLVQDVTITVEDL